MAMTLWSALLILIFIANPFHSVSLASNSLNPNFRSNSRANNGDASSQKLWCVAKNNAEDSALQTALDWACGPGGVDCGPIQQGFPCYDPTNLQVTASYVFNDYFRTHSESQQNCNFGNTAALSSLDPSHGSCKIPFSTSYGTNGSGAMIGPNGANTNGADQIVGMWDRALITVHLVFVTLFLFR